MKCSGVRISTFLSFDPVSNVNEIPSTFKTRTRRDFLTTSIFGTFLWPSSANAELPCRGIRGYELQKCLREKRRLKESPEQTTREEYLKLRQFEQPGVLVTLPNGLQYREMESGTSEATVIKGAVCSASYIIYRLSSGAYFKYSSGGTPVYLFSLGYGFEGKDDVDGVYQFRFGEKDVLPLAVAGSIEGMRVGGRRRILVPPQLGWTDDKVFPKPDTFGGSRRLASHRDEPLLFEIEIKRIQPPKSLEESAKMDEDTTSAMGDAAFTLPGPPPSFQK